MVRARESSTRERGGQRLFAGGVAPYYLAILAVVILVGISAVMVVSASSGEAILSQEEYGADIHATLAAFGEGINNLIFICVSAFLAFVISRLDYRRFAPWSFAAALVVMCLLIYTLIAGQTILGAQRWIQVGPVSLQPSEFAKPILLVFVAYVLAYLVESGQAEESALRRVTVLVIITALIVGAVLACIMLQPDLGTMLIIAAGLLVVYQMSGYGLRYMNLLIPLAAVGLVIRAFFSGNYQSMRIQGLIQGLFEGQYSHQVTQGLFALGSGGLFGAGLGLSRQKYFYLPEAQNDFILAVIGEEMGLFGTLLVVAAFALLMWAGFSITAGAKDRMGRVLAASATTLIITQAVMNLYAVVGLGPVTGKPLPFVTLGGSAMMSSFILLGIILSVARFGGENRQTYESHSSFLIRLADALAHGNDGAARKQPRKRREPVDESYLEPQGGDEDEGDLEWRWDGRARVSGTGARR